MKRTQMLTLVRLAFIAVVLGAIVWPDWSGSDLLFPSIGIIRWDQIFLWAFLCALLVNLEINLLREIDDLKGVVNRLRTDIERWETAQKDTMSHGESGKKTQMAMKDPGEPHNPRGQDSPPAPSAGGTP